MGKVETFEFSYTIYIYKQIIAWNYRRVSQENNQNIIVCTFLYSAK
jgi:hypothetical protein